MTIPGAEKTPKTLGRYSVCLLAVMVASAPVAAQRGTFDHTSHIDRGLANVPDLTRVPANQSAGLASVATHLLNRGQFLLDLYEFHRLLTRDYALQRDSIGRSGGVRTAGVQYLLGRALHEIGNTQAAAAAYRAAARDRELPEQLRSSLTAWEQALQGSGDGWRTKLAEWRAGRAPAGMPRCTADEAAACELFRAIVANDVNAVRRLQRPMLAATAPFHTFVAPNVRIEFHDPLPLLLLATADFVIAAKLAEQIRDADLVQGVALLRAGRLAEAEPVLRRATGRGRPDGAIASAYLGEVLYRLGRTAQAQELWRSVGEPGTVADLYLLEIQSGLGLGKQTVQDRFRALQSRNLRRAVSLYGGGHLQLARALVRHGLPEQANELLDAGRPPNQQSTFDAVSPQVFVLYARAHYEAGRKAQARRGTPAENVSLMYYLARGDLAAPLAASYPVAVPLLEMFQEITGLRVPAYHAR